MARAEPYTSKLSVTVILFYQLQVKSGLSVKSTPYVPPDAQDMWAAPTPNSALLFSPHPIAAVSDASPLALSL